MSNLETHHNFKLDRTKVDQHTGQVMNEQHQIK